MLDVPVLPADQVRGYIDISMMVCNTNPAWIQDNGRWVAMEFTKEEGYFFYLFGRPPSYFGFEEFMNENCATWMYNDVELQSPESNACGYHVIAFCLSRINNMCHYFRFKCLLKCNLHSIFPRRGPALALERSAGPPRRSCRYSSNHVHRLSIQL